MVNKMADALFAILLLIYLCMGSGSKWPMNGPRPCAYACAYVDPVFTSQSYDISISTSSRRTNLSIFLVLILMSTQFSLAIHMCLCLCLCASENQGLLQTANRGLRIAISQYPSAHIWDLDSRVVARGCHVCFHLSTQFYFSCEIVFKKNLIIDQRKSSKKQHFLSNVELWCFWVQKNSR